MSAGCYNENRSPDLPPEYQAALDRITLSLCQYRTLNSHWPQSLADLHDQSLTSFKGLDLTYSYNPTNPLVTVPIDLPPERDILHMITRGRYGRSKSLNGIAREMGGAYSNYLRNTKGSAEPAASPYVSPEAVEPSGEP